MGGNLKPPPTDLVYSLLLSLFWVQAKKKLTFIIKTPFSLHSYAVG